MKKKKLEVDKRTKYEKWSAHANLKIEYETYFFKIIEKIEDDEVFTFLRICDGDYHNIFLKQSCGGLVDANTISKVSESLEKILELKTKSLEKREKSNLILGLQFGTQYDKQFDEYIEKYTLIKNDGYSSSLFSWAYATDNMTHLFRVLNESKQPIIVVGPEYMKFLNNKFKISSHIKTPIQNTWLHQDIIDRDLQHEIQYFLNQNKNPIILYACSVSAKLAISKFYHLFGSKITQIDIGSNFDPYANQINRDWHISEKNRDQQDLFAFYKMDRRLGTKVKYRDFEISTWCYDIPERAKDYIRKNIKDNSILVEIGVHGGSTLLKVYDLVEHVNCKIYGIDCWEDIEKIGINGIDNSFWTKHSFDDFIYLHKQNRLILEKILDTYDSSKRCKLIKGFSQDKNILSEFPENSIDYLYIDGDHSYYGCYRDLKLWYPKVKKGGLIIGDDTNLPSIKKAIKEFCQNNSISFEFEGNKFYILK